jgi:hypothetical protein
MRASLKAERRAVMMGCSMAELMVGLMVDWRAED